MPRYVAFLRAINVGGRTVKMDRLRAIFEGAGLSNVATVIASGNVVFDSPRSAASLERAIEAALEAELGYAVATMLRTPAELAAIVDAVERDRLAEGVTLYVGFLKRVPAAAAVRAAVALSNEVDTLSVRGRELYWRCATAFSRSTLTGAKIEKQLQVAATLRNLNTVERLARRG